MNQTGRIDAINIGLMLISCIAAFIMPFEVFLFAYAFMGPLHYLTEISWLHDRQYFTKGKYDYLVLLFFGIIITWEYFGYKHNLWPFTVDNREITSTWNLGDKFIILALLAAIIMAFVKSVPIKVICLIMAFVIANQTFKPDEEGQVPNSNLVYILTAFVPTLIHVYVFTGIFMLFGALKSRSKMGLWSFFTFVLCPILLVVLFRDQSFIHVTKYGMSAYGGPTSSEGFFDLNQSILNRFFEVNPDYSVAKTQEEAEKIYNSGWLQNVFYSKTGILLMRFIAFAYMYHYLNWFSKTEIIRWHKVPKVRFVVVLALWIASVVIYAIDYKLGLQWLFFLSFTHVLLEFPLNAHSFAGVVKELRVISKEGFTPQQLRAAVKK
jgi:hypothetical protein